MPLIALAILASCKGKGKSSRVPKILPVRERSSGRFLSGKGPQGFLGSGSKRDSLHILSSRKRTGVGE